MMKSSEEKKKTADTLFYAPDFPHITQLPEQESQHAIRVLRLSMGDEIMVTDGKGFFYKCTIIDAHHKRCTVQIDETIQADTGRDQATIIAFAPTKSNDRNEWFGEKATEVGIEEFLPMACQFSERKSFNSNRFERVVVAAMKQSQQGNLPAIHELTPFNDVINRPFDGKKYIAHCYKEQKEMLSHHYTKGENALILIGPEGDFSKDEVEAAIEAGFIPISLGNTRLRTETAALVACHTIQLLNL